MGHIVGQSLNERKSRAWGTNTNSRKIAKRLFPNMTHEHCVDVLGAKILTTEVKNTAWQQAMTDKILREIKPIKTIPCSAAIHEHLVSMKVMPQINFATHINSIPKEVLKSIQSHIVD